MRTYTIVVEPDETGDLVVSVPALPGCFTRGRSLDECRQRVRPKLSRSILPGYGLTVSQSRRKSAHLSYLPSQLRPEPSAPDNTGWPS